MDKYWPIILSVFFLGLTPISNDYGKKEDVENEFKNLYGQAQDQQFTVYTATPSTMALKDGQIVIWRIGDTTGLMFRSGNEIYKVNASCVTVTR